MRMKSKQDFILEVMEHSAIVICKAFPRWTKEEREDLHSKVIIRLIKHYDKLYETNVWKHYVQLTITSCAVDLIRYNKRRVNIQQKIDPLQLDSIEEESMLTQLHDILTLEAVRDILDDGEIEGALHGEALSSNLKRSSTLQDILDYSL